MTNMKNTKRALLSSVVALFLCFTMLLGTTFAWFTDSVTSANNIIKSGTLVVEMYYADGTKAVPADDSADWKNADGVAIYTADQLWEPGYTDAKHIKISNEGTLALKYQLAIVPTGEVSELAEVIDVYYIEDATQIATRDDLANYAPIGTLDELINNGIKRGNLSANTDYTATLVLKMQENAGNEYQDLSIGDDFTIQLLATQYTEESDSFDNQYDDNAWHPDMVVYTIDQLEQALANGGKIQVNGTLNAGATQDVPNWTNAPAEFIFDATTLDALKGGKYVLEQGSRYGVVGLISAGESLALSDMEITANSQWPVYLSNYGGTLTLEDIDVTATQGAGIYPYGTNGTTTIKSATVNQKALSDEFASSTPWAGTAIATSNGHNLIIEDGTYIGSTWGVYVYNSGANVTINGGTFKAPKVIQTDGVWSTGGNKSVVTVNDGNFDGALYLDWGTTPPEIYINGGNFTNFSATVNGAAKLVIKGGTFDVDPSTYVATGFKAVENGGTYYVVSDEIDAVVTTSADLAAAIAQGGTVYVAADIDVNNAWTSVKPSSELTVLGNGKSITNLNLPLLAGGVSVKVTFKGLTIADSNVAPAAYENGLGSGAFIPYVDAYGDVAFEDCHLVNTTVTGNERAGGFVGYTSGQTLSLKDCTVDKCEITAVGGAAGLVAYSQTVTTIEDCSVTNTKVAATEDRLGTKAALAGSVIGTVNANIAISNLTASGNTVSNNNALPAFSNEIGRIASSGNLTIDGAIQKAASDQNALNSAVASGSKVEVSLSSGNYTMPESALQGKTITISGTKDTVIDMTAVDARDQFVTGANIVFDGVTLNFGTVNYMGLANTTSLTYRNCQINGLQFLYGENVTFENCVLNSNGAEHCVWTYGAKTVNFIGCDFTYGDRGINCYSDNDVVGGKQTVNFTDCTFTTTNTASEGAVEINSVYFSVGIEVNMEGCTAPAYGEMAYVSPWDSNNGAKTTINIK